MTTPSKAYPKKLDVITTTIAQSTNLSGIIDLGSGTPVLIEMSAGWDTAGITFHTSRDGSNFQAHYDAAGNETTVSAVAGRNIWLDPAIFAGVTYAKIRSGTVGTPVNQTALRTLAVVVRVL